MGGVLHNAGRSVSAPADGRDAAIYDFPGRFNHPLQCLRLSSRAVSVPGGDGERDGARHHTLYKAVRTGVLRPARFSLLRK